jgi:hypothetical protein
MSSMMDGWSIDLTPVKDASLSELSILALYANSGAGVIRLIQRDAAVDELCASLARQALTVFGRVAVPAACIAAFEVIASGRRPTGDLDAVRDVVNELRDALEREYERAQHRFDEIRGTHRV